MPIATTFVGIITAVGTVLTALALVITALTERRRSKRLEAKVDHAVKTGDENHVMLNQQRTDMERWIRVLERTVTEGGLTMPINQAIDPSKD
jgi:hypothetical protein